MTRWLETDSLSNQDISSALAIGAYTADADRLILVQWFCDQASGNGDYVFYVTHQINGAGSSYRYIPITTAAASSGVTAIAGQSGMIAVRSGDVLTVYLDGLAGDTTTPDTIVRWFELDVPTAATVASAVRTELATELAHLDEDVSSRLAFEDYTPPPSAADVATAVVRKPYNGYAEGSFGNVNEWVPSAATVASQVDVTLSAAHGSGPWGGSGAGTGTYSDTVTDGADPLDNVLVQLSTDEAGANIAYSTHTAADGSFTMRPDPGTYYVWLELAGYEFTQGAEVTVA